MTGRQDKKPHHHGNLREALIMAGTGLLDEGGQTALTLRKCAARAGASHAAPAHYFNGLSGLLTAIAARGYEIFTGTMSDNMNAQDSDPHAQLLAICNGYLRFSRDHQSLFRLMFASEELDFADPELQHHANAAYQVLRQGCAPFAGNSAANETVEIMVWSLVHGFASISQSVQKSPGGHPAHSARFEDVFAALGLKSV